MTGFRYSPAFRVQPLDSESFAAPVLEPISVFNNNNSDAKGLVGPWPSGTQFIRVYASRLATFQSVWISPYGVPPINPLTSASDIAMRIRIQPRLSHRAYWVFRQGPDTGGQWHSTGWASSDGRNQTEIWLSGAGGTAQPLPLSTPSSWDDPITFPLSSYVVSGPTSSPTLSPQAGNLERCWIRGVSYEDLSPDPEREDLNMRVRRRERGVRPRVEIRFVVLGGSTFERDLLTVYDAKLAGRANFRVLFTLNHDSNCPIWRDVSIVGNFPRRGFGGRNAYVEVSWTLVCLDPIDQVPAMQIQDGRGFW